MALIENHSTSLHHSDAPVRPTLMTRLAVWRSRRALAQLDAAALRDIGISAKAAQDEAQHTIWDVPVGWTERQ